MAKRGRAGGGDFWKTRIGRGHYWLGIGVVVTVGVLLALVGAPAAILVLGLPILILFIFRLHDLGRSGWWGFGVNVVTNMTGKIGEAMASDESRTDLVQAGGVVALLALLAWLGFLVGLGVVRGDPGPNRFGRRRGEKGMEQEADVFS